MAARSRPSPGLRALRKERLSDRIVTLVLDGIRSGDYGPDDLITEPGLTERLETSRTPVREALFRLVGNGVLSERGRGYCLPVLSAPEVAHMFGVRRLVEGEIMRLIAAAGSVRDLAALRNCGARERAAIERTEVRDFIAANTRFRQQLFATCDNRFLVEIADDCNDRMQAYRAVTLTDQANRRRVSESHEQLIAALAENRGADALAIYLAMLDDAAAAYAAIAATTRRPG